jgi:hypothetical protein
MKLSLHTVTALAILALGACARHQERELTGWLKVDIVRPVTGTSGVFVAGRNEEIFQVKAGSEWEAVGAGHPARYLLLQDPDKEDYDASAQPAALVDLNDGKGFQVLRAGQPGLQPLAAAFGRTGEFSLPSSRTAIDFWECRERATPTGCRDLRIHRYHPTGTLAKTFEISLNVAFPGCRLQRVVWYDSADVPYVNADCEPSERAQCLVVAPRKDGLFVHAVGRDRPSVECSDFPGLGVAKAEPAHFEVLY